MVTVFQSKLRSCSSQWNCVTPRKKGRVPLSEKHPNGKQDPPSWVPRSRPNQIFSPFAFRGPSQIMSIACASSGVRQLVAGAVGAPATNCLTPLEAQAIDMIWDGPRNAKGEKIWFGLDRGTQLGGSCF